MILAQGSNNNSVSGNRVSQSGSNGFGHDHRHQKLQLYVSAPAQLQTNLDTPLACQEEITSIFVMGFPDDMNEREFVNMFTFCPGFEGAKLKIPPQLVGGNSNPSLNAGSSASCVGLDDTSSDSYSSSSSSKKQCSSIIGFAKFRTREQALIAIQVLTGRKVDQEKYNVLKAEFAKKDLHIRKTYIDSNQEHQLPRTLSSLLSIQLNNSSNTSNNPSNMFLSQGSSSFEGDQWANLSVYNPARTPTTPNNTILPHSVPKFVPNRSLYIPDGFFGPMPYTAPVGSEVSVDHEYFDLPPRLPQSFAMMHNDRDTPLAEIPNPDKFLPSNLFSDKDSTKDVPGGIVGSEGVDQPADKNISSPVTGRALIGNQNQGFESALYHNLETSFATLSTPITNPTYTLESKPDGTKQQEHHTEQSTQECPEEAALVTKTERLVPSNPSNPHLKIQAFDKPNSNPYLIHNTFVPVKPLASDQNNPPCNTLYVGNLPMNAHENELKDLFSVCPGYKRLCFRTKNNGPMCFVEFESIDFATKAMHSLYGTLLSNSTKGGIRLSFSKNPLGIRLNANTTTTSSGNISHHNINSSSFNKQKSHNNNLSGGNLSHDHQYGGMVSAANSAWGKQQQHHYH